MVIINEKLLTEFRTAGPCAYCGRRSSIRQPHHIICRGMGSGKRLDVRINLVALGHAFSCPCHADAHRGDIIQADFFAVVAARDNLMQHNIEAVLAALRKIPHRPLRFIVEAVVSELTAGQRELIGGIPEIREILG